MAKIMPLFTDERNERKIDKTKKKKKKGAKKREKIQNVFFFSSRFVCAKIFRNEKNGRWMV